MTDDEDLTSEDIEEILDDIVKKDEFGFRFDRITPELQQQLKHAFEETVKRNMEQFKKTRGWDERITTLDRY